MVSGHSLQAAKNDTVWSIHSLPRVPTSALSRILLQKALWPGGVRKDIEPCFGGLFGDKTRCLGHDQVTNILLVRIDTFTELVSPVEVSVGDQRCGCR